MYYRRNGQEISLEEWATSCEKLERRVALTNLRDGKIVSTVFLGIDHNWGFGKPLIFETMVFPSENSFEEIDMARYSTEREAIIGHNAMIKKWEK